MSGKRVKALRREFHKTFGRSPEKAVRELETRSVVIGVDGKPVAGVQGKRIYWQQMTVVKNDEFRAFRKKAVR